MSDMNLPQKSGKRKLQTLRLDLTPMVDLGFILVTFFILTTTMAESRVMQVVMPDSTPTQHPTVVVEESMITLMPINDHKVMWYEGSLKNAAQVKECSRNNVRAVLLRKKKEVLALPALLSYAPHELFVLIKPADNCKYDDVVHLLDEMTIVAATHYMLTDLSAEEKTILAKK